MNALEAALAAPWAMTEEWIQTVLAIAGRTHDLDVGALEAYRARQVPGSDRLKARDGVGILTARGPMFRYANLFTAISGATSYETLALDLRAALDDPSLRAILLNIDSPGGEANGVDELAKAVFEARGRKPIAAYIGGSGTSAAYWFAAAADTIVVSDLAVVGSIGVKMATLDTTERDKRSGIARIEIVSSQTPGKRVDVATDEGRARLQRVADSMADVFIAAVARYRGVETSTVTGEFGAGDVLVGAAAVDAGMADRIGDFETLLSDLSRGRPTARRPPSSPPRGPTMSNETISAEAHRQAVAEAETKAAAAAQERISAILGSEHAKGRETLAQHLAFKTSMQPKDAVAALEAAPKAAEPEKTTEAKEPEKDGKASADKGYLQAKAEAKALGLGEPDKAVPKAASWDKAVAKVNARIAH